MTNQPIARQRLYSQRLAGPPLDHPSTVVGYLGAVQAQDYAGVKWALGMRAKDTTDTSVEQALDDGLILRTHVLRPTWHFVVPDDIRWMLGLSAPQIEAAVAPQYRRLGLDRATPRWTGWYAADPARANK